MSRISPEWEAVRKTAAAGSTPERGSTSGAVLTLWTDSYGLLDERDPAGEQARGYADEAKPRQWCHQLRKAPLDSRNVQN